MHIPVLKKEAIEVLNPTGEKNFVDCTFGEGGHTKEILKKKDFFGKVLAIEIDPELYERGKALEKEFKGRLILKRGSFANLKEILEKENFKNIFGILFDLGISLWHLKESKRGFSFQKDEILIMRYDKNLKDVCAIDVINKFPKRKIEWILKEFGQEKYAKKIASEIEKERKKKKIETTFDLVEVIKKALPKSYQRGKIHFATKTFLALRIFVNQELENLKKALPQAFEVLERGGRLVVISFHSLEDKIVKNFFRILEREKKAKLLTKKPILPKKEEILFNPRARSAKLRAIEKL